MPALVLFGRRWQFGSDDLVLPSFIDLLFRIVWVIVAALTVWKDESRFSCTGGHVLEIYFYLTFISLHLAIFINLAIFQSSKAGSIMNVKPRRLVPLFVYTRLSLHVAEIGIHTGGAICVFRNIFGCNQDGSSINLVTGLVISNFVLVGAVGIAALVTFDPLGTTVESSEYGNSENELPPLTKNAKVWERRCRLVACMCSYKDTNIQTSFEECGKILGAGFQDVDLVLSDITAALMLLFMENIEHNASEFQAVVTVSSPSPKLSIVDSQPILSKLSSSQQWDSPKLVNHFLKYGVAGYTTFAVYFARKNPLRRLWKNTVCCICFPGRNHPLNIEGDDCCACHTAAIKDLTENDFENIVHASYKNDYFKSPFFVALDHQTRSIVISIRPSLSIKDFITDLTCWPVFMDIPGLPSNFMCHHGVKLGASIMKAKLESLNLLNKLHSQHPDYKLILTGNSLGAATAVVLGMMLRSQYPSLKVYAYSPPGGLLSKEAAEYCDEFVISVTYGDDLVARLSILACQELKHRMIEALCTSEIPKYKILLRGCWLALGGKAKTDSHEVGNLRRREDRDKIPGAGGSSQQDGDGFHCVSLFPPGRILHITELYSPAKSDSLESNCIGSRWQYRWADRNEFGKFVLSPRMFLDHMPFRMLKALDHLQSLNSLS